MHVVLRSSRAVGGLAFTKRQRQIEAILNRQAIRFGVKLYRRAIAGNHLHLIVLPRSRAAYAGFVRAIAGILARLVLGCERGRAKGLKFWDSRPWSRIVSWGRDFLEVCAYVFQNKLEATGFIPYQPRGGRYVSLLAAIGEDSPGISG